MLSQSIIHVEKDDVQIDSDEEDDDDAPAPAPDAMEVESSQPGPSASSPIKRVGSPARDPTAEPATPAVDAAPKKVKVTITYDKYMTIMQMVVYHLADIERETMAGLPRSEIVQWYLEQKESEIGDVDELEAERALIEKVLTKLIKVRCTLSRSL